MFSLSKLLIHPSTTSTVATDEEDIAIAEDDFL